MGSIKAHKTFLAMGSPVFQAMFYGEMAQASGKNKDNQDEPIKVPDVEPSAFSDLLEFFYFFFNI